MQLAFRTGASFIDKNRNNFEKIKKTNEEIMIYKWKQKKTSTVAKTSLKTKMLAETSVKTSSKTSTKTKTKTAAAIVGQTKS